MNVGQIKNMLRGHGDVLLNKLFTPLYPLYSLSRAQPEGYYSFFHRVRVLRHFVHLCHCFFDGQVLGQFVATE